MTNHRLYLHYLGLAGVIVIGTILRFWHLGLKPLWMDEIITAIFSLGKNYNDLPLDVVFPLERVQEIFTFQPGVSCSQIAENVTTQSTHPPLFFCSMYSWLGWMTPLGSEWVEKLRSLPALFGVGASAAIYAVNRIAFSKTSAIMAAAIMAVSPFAVYLSQEARHYTMPMLLITLALLGLVQIQQDMFERARIRFWVWLLWAIINSIGLYVHYFFALAFIAEIATLIVLMYWGKAKIINKHQVWLALIFSTSGIVISFIPWLLMILSHVRRSETSWLPSPTHIAPLYQTLISWVLMMIALPVENQPLPITVIYGFLMVIFAIWVGRQVFKGLKLLWLQSTTYLATFTLLSFTIFVLLQFLIIVYFLGKDITVVPRYNFVYYPSFCALIAASFGIKNNLNSVFIFLLVGLISCIFVVSNLVFQKPFQPEQVAQNMNLEPSVPIMLVVGYSNYQDVALGLSFATALEQLRSQTSTDTKVLNSYIDSDSFAFLQKSPDLSAVWQNLSQLPIPATSKLNLWVVGPGIRKRDYPQRLELSGQTCIIDAAQHYRIGVPYQLYRCSNL
ncbi:glycosyltransferase family 39 protein [Nostoc sp. MG11]|uniref:glycosyltransferase family 39 protein n=1 Tax=Nostoc sp. MG11 TaxID=2721166 RepID=UPI001866F56C|nr:glycosyltransferase family 39 protein [Nostoc sp. MG11]